ncbi:MAG: proprotein convertase P-domain-containing protein [Anaerolineae bacterium]|nr:proprotein convertase P-domain-containing protein [Anaerolineae bacterium]
MFKSWDLLFLIGIIIFLSWQFSSQAQSPSSATTPSGRQPLSQIDVLKLPPVDVQKLRQEDKQSTQPDAPLRFAAPIAVKVSPATHGTWEQIDPDTLLWRLRVVSPQALSLNFGFTRYTMPPGGQLFLYTPDASQRIGPFTAADNAAHGQLWTPLIKADDVVIEVTVPAATASQLALTLTAVNHGYREFGQSSVDKSGSCNVDVVCSEADSWRDEIRAVAVYSLNGTLSCSGSLINNTAQDLTPYFLTAAHCNVNSSNAASMVVYWNYENSTCRTPGSADSGNPGDGSLSQFNSGAIHRATYAPSDFTLVELDDPIDAAVNAYWAGWDNGSTTPLSAVAIHHPNTDEKRISFENDPLSTTTYLGTSSPGDGSHLRIIDWDLGTTESGSSGSPLFNPAGYIIGQLHGGYAACGNDSSDWYGRLSVSWDGGGTAATRLKDWLDPLSSGVTTLAGTNQSSDFTLEVTPTTLNICTPNSGAYTVSVGSNLGFSDPVTLSVNGQPTGTALNFNSNPVTPPGTSQLNVTKTAGLNGSYALIISGTSSSGIHTQPITLNLLNLPGTLQLTAPTNGAVDQPLNPQLKWSAASQAISYTVEVATDVTFNNVVYTNVVTGTQHNVTTTLQGNTHYYWRITPQNPCGDGSPSSTQSFTTLSPICRTPNLSIPDNDSTGVTDTLSLTTEGTLTDLNVSVHATHSWIGDLSFALEHVKSGTHIVLVDLPHNNPSCNGQNVKATLDDEAALSVDNECSTNTPSIEGQFKPDTDLSAFDGETLSGTWRLTASDNGLLDTGTLVEWCLHPAVDTPLLPLKTIYLPLIVKP